MKLPVAQPSSAEPPASASSVSAAEFERAKAEIAALEAENRKLKADAEEVAGISTRNTSRLVGGRVAVAAAIVTRGAMAQGQQKPKPESE